MQSWQNWISVNQEINLKYNGTCNRHPPHYHLYTSLSSQFNSSRLSNQPIQKFRLSATLPKETNMASKHLDQEPKSVLTCPTVECQMITIVVLV